MVYSKYLVAILLVCSPLIFNIALAAENNSNTEIEGLSEDWTGIERLSESPYALPERTPYEWYSSLGILLYSLLLCILITFLIIRQNTDGLRADSIGSWDPMSVIRFFGLTFIITTGMYLIVSGYSDQQIAGMMGLLGSLAGYLLGESKERK